LLKQSLGFSVTIRVDLAPHLKPALTDANQLELAILNLALNARDAMPDGGTVTIATAEEELPAGNGTRNAGGYVAIRVSDDGAGMPDEIAARAFDPFFTTKPPGKGTGLGLAQVYGIARQCGGDARIVSRAGTGTHVTLWLPRADGLAAPPPPADESIMADRRSGKILLVDDDPDVRTLIADVLTGIGYDVTIACNGEEALARLCECVPHLLVVDFAMPGMNGADVAKAARQSAPDLPILFLSGHIDTAALTAAVHSTAFLRKPFRPVELAAAVRETLGNPAQAGI
jgi:CheY-like chemotaxis protein